MKNIKQIKNKLYQYFKSLIKKILITQYNKINNFIHKYNETIKHFNLTIKKILIKQYNKIKNYFLDNYKLNKKKKIKILKKFLISFIALLFIYMFYLLIPTLYDKTWVQNNIENKLLNEFKIKFSFSSEISYEILPSPNFTIENVKIMSNKENDPNEIADIKKLKVFISQENFFKQKKLKIKKILIKNANFKVVVEDTSFYKKFFNNKFSEKKIIIKNSNIFLKRYDDEIISIFRISKIKLFHDKLDLANKFDVNGKGFKVPFNFKLEKFFLPNLTQTTSNIQIKKLKLNIENELNERLVEDQKIIEGMNLISTLNLKLATVYDIKKNSISFASDQLKLTNNNFNYEGELSLKPFNLDLDINFDKFKIVKLIDSSTPYFELFKTNLLFNENISANIKIDINNDLSNRLFNSTKLLLNINNGKINFNESEFLSNKVGLLKIRDSNLFFENDNLILRSNFVFDIKNYENFYSFFQTSKKYRKPIKKIFLSLDYNFFEDGITINNFKIDDRKISQRNSEIISSFNDLEKNNFNNFIKNKNFLNRLLVNYDG